MEPGGSIPHSQGLSNNSYPEPNQPNSPHCYLSLPGPFSFFFAMVVPNYPSTSEALCDVYENPCFYSVRLLASRQSPKLEDHPWSAVHDCLFNIFAANFHLEE